jgi:hypothetical protein
MTDERMNVDLITDIMDVLDRHGYARADDEHVGRAVRLLGDLVRAYEGTTDVPRGAYAAMPPSPLTASRPSSRVGQNAAILTGADVSTAFAALDIAADYKRDRAAACADCADQTCPTCQSRLRDAQAYDRLADQILRVAEASTAPEQPGPDRAEPARSHPQAVADREAGR